MINPSQAWCIQINVTELCWPKAANGQLTSCSNCTRGIGHIARRYIAPLDDVERAYRAVATFPTASDPCPQGRRKVVGCFGAEPLFHPKFPEIVDIAVAAIPEVWNRGLWTSLPFHDYVHPVYGAALPHVEKLIGEQPNGHVAERKRRKAGLGGYLNWNQHKEEMKCEHQPVLMSISDVVKDEKQKWDLIEDCWVQREWSPLIGPNHQGELRWYFCEVAQTHDRLFNLGVGLPVEPECWRGEIRFETGPDGVRTPVGKYADQIKACCSRCGAPIPFPGRRDLEFRDDVSPQNLVALQAAGSPMVKRGDVVVHSPDEPYDPSTNADWKPYQYIKGHR